MFDPPAVIWMLPQLEGVTLADQFVERGLIDGDSSYHLYHITLGSLKSSVTVAEDEIPYLAPLKFVFSWLVPIDNGLIKSSALVPDKIPGELIVTTDAIGSLTSDFLPMPAEGLHMSIAYEGLGLNEKRPISPPVEIVFDRLALVKRPSGGWQEWRAWEPELLMPALPD